MNLNRREFVRLMGLAGAAGIFPAAGFAAASDDSKIYDMPAFGNARILHFTDCHAQLNPIYFREPNVNLGIGAAFGKAPHLVGSKLLEHFSIAGGGIEEHAYTYLNFEEAARMFGKVGGDTWQGSGTAYWTRGRDMVDACNLLGVDVMTGHWEFTYLASEILDNAEIFEGEFVSQNCKVKEDALFDYEFADGRPAYCRRRPVVPVYADRQPATLHPGLDLRHQRGRHAGSCRSGA
jgi:sulfur-oxidizing protein SoxB